MTSSSRTGRFTTRAAAVSAGAALVAAGMVALAPATHAQSAEGADGILLDLGSVQLYEPIPDLSSVGAMTLDGRTNSLGLPSPFGGWATMGSLGVSGEVLDLTSFASLAALVGGAAAAAGALPLGG